MLGVLCPGTRPQGLSARSGWAHRPPHPGLFITRSPFQRGSSVEPGLRGACGWFLGSGTLCLTGARRRAGSWRRGCSGGSTASLTPFLPPCGEGRAGPCGAQGDGCDGCAQGPCTPALLPAPGVTALAWRARMPALGTPAARGERSPPFSEPPAPAARGLRPPPTALRCRVVAGVLCDGCAWLSPSLRRGLPPGLVPRRCCERPGVPRGEAWYEPSRFFHHFLLWACFPGSASAVIQPGAGAGSQPWSPSLGLASLTTKTSSQLLTSAPHTPALLGGVGGFTRVLLGQGQCPSLLGVGLWRASVNTTALRRKMMMVKDQTRGPTSNPVFRSPRAGGSVPSAFFSLPGDLFQVGVTVFCPGTLLPAGSTAPAKLRPCLWVPSPMSVTPPLLSPLVPTAGRACSCPPPAPAQHIASCFPFLSPRQSHPVHPGRLGTRLGLPEDPRAPGPCQLPGRCITSPTAGSVACGVGRGTGLFRQLPARFARSLPGLPGAWWEQLGTGFWAGGVRAGPRKGTTCFCTSARCSLAPISALLPVSGPAAGGRSRGVKEGAGSPAQER